MTWPPLPLLLPGEMRLAALSFASSTGVGADTVHPRAFAALSDRGLEELAAIYQGMEATFAVPAQWRVVLVCLIPKEGKPGETRPIALLASALRLHGRLERPFRAPAAPGQARAAISSILRLRASSSGHFGRPCSYKGKLELAKVALSRASRTIVFGKSGFEGTDSNRYIIFIDNLNLPHPTHPNATTPQE